MIPAVNDDLLNDFEVEQTQSKTYKLHVDTKRMYGFTDQLDAVKQAVYLMLNVERYDYLIFSWNYGVELRELFGKPTSYVLPEIKRRISEALTQDDRIESVNAFSFETDKGKVLARFTVHTIFGDFEGEREVNI